MLTYCKLVVQKNRTVSLTSWFTLLYDLEQETNTKNMSYVDLERSAPGGNFVETFKDKETDIVRTGKDVPGKTNVEVDGIERRGVMRKYAKDRVLVCLQEGLPVDGLVRDVDRNLEPLIQARGGCAHKPTLSEDTVDTVLASSLLPDMEYFNTVKLPEDFEYRVAEDVADLVPTLNFEQIVGIIAYLNEEYSFANYTKSVVDRHNMVTEKGKSEIMVEFAEWMERLRLRFGIKLDDESVYSDFDESVAKSLFAQLVFGESMKTLNEGKSLSEFDMLDQIKKRTPIISNMVDPIHEKFQQMEESTLTKALHVIFGNREEAVDNAFLNVETHIDKNKQDKFKYLVIEKFVSKFMPDLSTLGLELDQQKSFIEAVASSFVNNYVSDTVKDGVDLHQFQAKQSKTESRVN